MSSPKTLTISIATFVISAVALWLIFPFLATLIASLAFAIFLTPAVQRISSIRFIGERFAAGLILLILLLVGGVPLWLLSKSLVEQGYNLSTEIVPFFQNKLLPKLSLSLPEWIPFAEEIGPLNQTLAENMGQFAQSAIKGLVGLATPMTRGVIMGIFNVFVFFYSAFFFLTEGKSMRIKFFECLPFRPEEVADLQNKVTSMVTSSFKSILVIGVVQATLVGIAFWFCGIPNAVLWASLVVITSAIPGLGSPVVWWPGVIYLLVNGSIGFGIGLIFWGLFAVGWVDNILRPRIIGHDTKTSDLSIFLATVGAILAFGPLGIFVGPVLLAVAIWLFSMLRQHFSSDDAAGPKKTPTP